MVGAYRKDPLMKLGIFGHRPIRQDELQSVASQLGCTCEQLTVASIPADHSLPLTVYELNRQKCDGIVFLFDDRTDHSWFSGLAVRIRDAWQKPSIILSRA